MQILSLEFISRNIHAISLVHSHSHFLAASESD